MKLPDAVRERLSVAWRRNWTDWLGGGGRWPLALPLAPPSEAIARSQWPRFQEWVRTWAEPEWAGQVSFEPRAWSHLGPQQIPTQVRFETPEAVADALGDDTRRRWDASASRWSERVTAWPELVDELRAIAGWMGGLDEADYRRFVAAFDWLAAHPDSGLYVRQLPIAGVDTKWVESHAAPLSRLLAARLGREPVSLAKVAGLSCEPTRRRIRLLDPSLREQFCGLSDLQVRTDELVDLHIRAKVAIVVENQQTALACTDLDGAVLLMGGGFAVTELGRIPWLAKMPLVYWGDIDTAGLAILNALRAWHPHTKSCLMDVSTLLAHRELWSHERNPTVALLEHLTPGESGLYQELVSGAWGPGVRLEQERLQWSTAWEALVQTVRIAVR